LPTRRPGALGSGLRGSGRLERGLFSFSIPGVISLLVWGLLACGPGPPREEPLYVLAAEALGSQAYRDRQKVVNPRLVSLDNPRLPHRVLDAFRNRGYEIMETVEEDSTRATYYLSTPTLVAGDTFQIRVHVSLGGRMGSMERGDTWWLVTGICGEGCGIVEVTPVDNRSWP